MCGKYFLIKYSRLAPQYIWQEYTTGKQTYAQLAARHNCSIKTIQRKIDSVKPSLKVLPMCLWTLQTLVENLA